jgi:hypothetical protein
MNLSDWANIATIVQGVFVIVSIGFVLYQLRESTRLTKAANTEKLVELVSPLHLQLVQDRETAKLWVQGAKEFDFMDEVDKQRYDGLLMFWLVFQQNIYHQHKKKLLDDDTFTAWTNDLKLFIQYQHLERRWPDMKKYHEPLFVEYIDDLIAGREPKKSVGPFVKSLMHRLFRGERDL